MEEEKRKTPYHYMIYFNNIEIGTKYRICSFSEEHVFTYESLDFFENDRCLYCSNKLIDKIFIQEIYDS
jgi:hypothetical protein